MEYSTRKIDNDNLVEFDIDQKIDFYENIEDKIARSLENSIRSGRLIGLLHRPKEAIRILFRKPGNPQIQPPP